MKRLWVKIKENEMKKLLIALIFIGVLFAQDNSVEQKPEKMLIEGEIVGLACYTSSGLKGSEHKSCAKRCLTRGTPAGILDKDGNLFVIAAPSPGYSAYAAETIRLNGLVIDGRISPDKMEIVNDKKWEEVSLVGGSPKSNN